MIIQCDKCSTKFKLDEAKITGKGIRVRCTKCQNVFAVAPPEPPAPAPPAPVPTVNERVDSSDGAETGAGENTGVGEGAGDTGAGFSAGDTGFTGFEAAPPPPGQDLVSQPSFGEQAFDFGTPPEGGFEASEAGQSAAGGADDWSIGGEGIGGGAGFDGAGALGGDDVGSESEGESHAFGVEGFDAGGVSGGDDAGSESEGESHAFGVEGFDAGGVSGGDDAGQFPAFGGDDAGAPPPQEEPFMQPSAAAPVSNEWQIGKAEEGDSGGDTTQTGAGTGVNDDDEGPSADSDDDAGEMPSEPVIDKPHSEMSDKEFAAALSESTEDEHKAAVAGDKPANKAAGAASKNAKLIPLIIIVLVIVGAAGWFFGIRGGQERPMTAPTVEIAAIEGRYTETKNLGSFFVIEAKIRNVTALPQPVKGVVGVLYDAKGAKLVSAPGRIISSDDINNLTREDLAKAVKPGAVGTIPSKGTLPVVVIFIETPAGMSEYGIEIMP